MKDLPKAKEDRFENYKEDVRERAYAMSLLALAVKLSRVDGKINSAETKFLTDIVSMYFTSNDQVQDLVAGAINDNTEFESYAKRLKKFFPSDDEILKEIISSLFGLASVDGPISAQEIKFLREVSYIFDLPESFFIKKLESYIIPNDSDSFKVLEVNKNVSYADLKRSYHAAVYAYHPDKLSSLESSEQIIDLANKRMSILNEAYSKIKTKKKF